MFRTAQSIRTISVTAVRNQDLVQQAFLKQIKEYAQKAGNLANSEPAVKKALQDELNRLAMKFQLSNSDVVAKIPTNFEAAKVESSVNELLAGQEIKDMLASVNKETTEYIASRNAKKAEEAARLAALKQ